MPPSIDSAQAPRLRPARPRAHRRHRSPVPRVWRDECLPRRPARGRGMIEIDVRADEFLSLMERFSAQAPFVQSVALNRTSEEGLAVLRQGMKERFILRAEAFDLPPQQLPAAFRATASRLWATVRLGYSDGPASIGGRREAIFGKFEEGGTKRGPDPNFPIAIPTKALRSDPRALVPRQLYPRYLLRPPAPRVAALPRPRRARAEDARSHTHPPPARPPPPSRRPPPPNGGEGGEQV